MVETPETEDAVHVTMESNDDTGAFTEVTELLHADAGDVSAPRVTLEQSTARSISADHVDVNKSAVKGITTQTATMTQAASLTLNAADIAVHESSIGVLSSDRIDLFDSVVGIARGPLTVNEGSARVLVHIGPADATVKPVLDGQTAMRLGAGFGISIVVLSRLLRRLFGT